MLIANCGSADPFTSVSSSGGAPQLSPGRKPWVMCAGFFREAERPRDLWVQPVVLNRFSGEESARASPGADSVHNRNVGYPQDYCQEFGQVVLRGDSMKVQTAIRFT